MGQLIRSARGEMIDFELLAIKQQLASAPVPKVVEDRKKAIDEKDGVRSNVVPDVDMDFLAASVEAAAASESRGKQLKRK